MIPFIEFRSKALGQAVVWFQALFGGGADWDLLLQTDCIKKKPFWQIDHGEIRTPDLWLIVNV